MMRGYFALVVFTAMLLTGAPQGATPRAYMAPTAATQQPALYLPFAAKNARLGQAAANTNAGLAGKVYVNPRWVVTQAEAPPIQYLILVDVTGSMSWDFNGYGTYDGTNTAPGYTVPNTVRGDVMCDAPDIPNPLSLPYTDRCIGGVDSAWKNQNERRVYVAKHALFGLINQLGAYDSMRLIGFSSSVAGSTQASSNWSSDKTALAASVLGLGAYNGDPYKTAGSASNAIAMQKARELLASAPTVAPNGQPHKQVVIMLTDSAANMFLDGTLNTARDICANLTVVEALRTADPCQLGTTSDGRLRPVSAMIDVANAIKSEHPNVEIYVVALAMSSSIWLAHVATDASFYYTASQPALLAPVLDQIQARFAAQTCTANVGNQWIDTVDTAHLPDPNIAPGLDNTVVGFSYIYGINSTEPLYTLPIRRDQATNRISFVLAPPDAEHPNAGIAPGNYEMEAYVGYKGDDQVSRAYDYFIDQSSRREYKRITFTVTSSASLGSPGQVIPVGPLFLDLPANTHLC